MLAACFDTLVVTSIASDVRNVRVWLLYRYSVKVHQSSTWTHTGFCVWIAGRRCESAMLAPVDLLWVSIALGLIVSGYRRPTIVLYQATLNAAILPNPPTFKPRSPIMPR